MNKNTIDEMVAIQSHEKYSRTINNLGWYDHCQCISKEDRFQIQRWLKWERSKVKKQFHSQTVDL